MASVHDQIINNQNNNTITQAEQNRRNGVKQSSSSVNSQDFLKLMTMQLQYQDPMSPMDNSQMLAQEAQFSTLEQMEALTSTFSKFSNIYQANSLLGQNVEVMVEGKTASGKVDYVDFSDSQGASIHIGDKNYPLSAVTKIYPEGEDANTGDDKNFFKNAIGYIAAGVGEIADAILKTNGGEQGGADAETPAPETNN